MDFTNIPEGATHYHPNNCHWYKWEDGVLFSQECNSKCDWNPSMLVVKYRSTLIEIPKQKKVIVQQGTWVDISEIPDVETWKKCIDAFVKAGAEEYEGYTGLCENLYTRLYHDRSVLEWWGDKGTLHSNNPRR